MDGFTPEQVQQYLARQVGGPTTAATSGNLRGDPLQMAKSLGQGVVNGVPDEAADIVKTVGKLRALSPLYTYALYHPVRFLLRFVVLPIPSLVVFLVVALFQLVFYSLKTLLFPIYTVVYFASRPFVAAFGVLNALMPLWIFLLSAVVLGAAGGATVGLVMGESTRLAVDETVRIAVWPLRVVGIVGPEGSTQTLKKRGFGSEGGARLERVPSRSTASKRSPSRTALDGRSRRTAHEARDETASEEEDEARSVRTRSDFGVRGRRRRVEERDMPSTSESEDEEQGAETVSEEEEAEEYGEEDRKPVIVRGRAKEGPTSSRVKVKSGWRARHVEGVL
ncbi:hypothetical protein JCM10212_003282 [Sporobolomyces blumeae]